MLFGNMQSYYRRNAIRSQSLPHGSQSTRSKEQNKRVNHLNKNEDGDNEENHNAATEENFSVRRKFFAISRNPENEEPVNDFKNIPVIKIDRDESECGEKSVNLLKGKEKVPWHKSYRDQDDNSERLGPNKNNIIEETLRLEKLKSGEWKQQL